MCWWTFLTPIILIFNRLFTCHNECSQWDKDSFDDSDMLEQNYVLYITVVVIYNYNASSKCDIVKRNQQNLSAVWCQWKNNQKNLCTNNNIKYQTSIGNNRNLTLSTLSKLSKYIVKVLWYSWKVNSIEPTHSTIWNTI